MKMVHITVDERQVFLPEFTAANVDVRIFPIALSKIARFNGMTRFFYSVAQHSCLVHDMAVVDYGEGSEVAKAALMHDAAEAYLGDVTTPLKRLLPEYWNIERTVTQAIRESLGLSDDPAVWSKVHSYDKMACNLEAKHLLFHPYDWIQEIPETYQQSHMAMYLRCQTQVRPESAESFLRTAMAHYGWNAQPILLP